MRNVFYGALRALGVTALWRWCNRSKLTIVCIHGVEGDQMRSGISPTRWQLSESELDRQLTVLKRKYEFVSVDDALKILSSDIRTGKPCALFTIDDGYDSAFELAWPVLKRHGIPAVVFIATKHMNTEEPFWWDRLDYVFLHLPQDVEQVHVGEHALNVDLTSRESRGESARYVTRHSRQLFENEHERFAALDALIQKHEETQWLQELDRWAGVMGVKDVENANNDGLEIGSHTVNHYRLGDLDRATIKAELCDSKVAIEQVLGQECRYFCYPEGSLSSVSNEEVRSAGYRCAFTSVSGLNGKFSDRFSLKRINLPRTASPGYLLAHVSGLDLMITQIRKKLVPR
jgi:peptidoglycan/xylan/chitin deacetylase (PgdA/CDA1 family)